MEHIVFADLDLLATHFHCTSILTDHLDIIWIERRVLIGVNPFQQVLTTSTERIGHVLITFPIPFVSQTELSVIVLDKDIRDMLILIVFGIVNGLIQLLDGPVEHLLHEWNTLLHHLVGECTMRSSQITRGGGDADSIRRLVLDRIFAGLFECRRCCSIDRTIEEYKCELVIPGIFCSLTTSHCVSLCLVTSRGHRNDCRVENVLDEFLVVLDLTLRVSTDLINIRMTHIIRQHVNRRLDTG